MLRERVNVARTSRATTSRRKLVERLGWAVDDADEVEHANPPSRADAGAVRARTQAADHGQREGDAQQDRQLEPVGIA